ncbi:hypothetical protein [Thermobispora bispora]|uniref:Uncharacterized protein n=1 Tax=Thermobispora bispora (strain ATCC 19993 / DSM 43833 / CBS 139.67 / JCM 10125 / KCTC 9307 / NBRC 14880 / R51) TaxID=469371 RepID=D6Y213_THEBD|nr:hypothetical protein [Thermobispora bispora]ADG86748.1 hypothetical protein Tbis_0011 [Thermobispora bispora DSM 43833]
MGALDAGRSSNFSMTVSVSGPVTEGGRLPLAELARIASGLQMTLERLALASTGTSIKPGRRPRDVVDAVRLDFTGFHEGSAVLEVSRPQEEAMNDLLRESLRMLGEGIEFLRQGHPLPAYLTPPVLNGLRELAGGISPHGVSRIQFQHPGGGFVIDSVFREALRRTPAQATEREVTVVGRLHMGDFSPATLRCRIDTYAGSILADFGSDLRDVILDAMDQLVMASGRAELQPDGVTVRVMHLETVKRLTGAPITPLDRLAQEQGVRPIGNVDELRGDPIDDLEEFLEVITAARRGEE